MTAFLVGVWVGAGVTGVVSLWALAFLDQHYGDEVDE